MKSWLINEFRIRNKSRERGKRRKEKQYKEKEKKIIGKTENHNEHFLSKINISIFNKIFILQNT